MIDTHIHGDMACPQLLFVYWCSSVLAMTCCMEVDGYLCLSDYYNTFTCVLNITANPVGQSNTTYYLQTSNTDLKCNNCLAMNHSYSFVCECIKEEYFESEDRYDLHLCNGSGCKLLTEHFEPSQNIQLKPPHKADVQLTPETINITWKSGYEDHIYFQDDLDYELLLQTSQSTKGKILHSSSTEKFIQKSQLEPRATYCIKVRSKPRSSDYNGMWSKWSPETCSEEEAGEEQENTFVILIQSLGPVCAIIGVLLFVFYSPAARMKIKTLSHTPSPAPFFQPLFRQHEGNLQKWLSPHGKFVLTYKTEEILTTDAVIVGPKPITKDPEENQDFHNLQVTQLAFTQCQTSYVGLPGMHEAPPPLTMACPGNTSYTQLPFSVWGFGIGEVEAVVSSPPKDLNISCADSGCSCEDLTQSPECSLPCSPIDYNPPPSTDYCVLNKTAEGIVPVLVSKGGSLNVPFEDEIFKYE